MRFSIDAVLPSRPIDSLGDCSSDEVQRNPGYENSVKKAPNIEHCCCRDGSRKGRPYRSSDKRCCLHAP